MGVLSWVTWYFSRYLREYHRITNRDFRFILQWNNLRDVLPYHVYLQFVSVDNVDLLENIVDVPHFDASVDARRYDAVPIADSQRLQLNDPREVRV